MKILFQTIIFTVLFFSCLSLFGAAAPVHVSAALIEDERDKDDQSQEVFLNEFQLCYGRTQNDSKLKHALPNGRRILMYTRVCRGDFFYLLGAGMRVRDEKSWKDITEQFDTNGCLVEPKKVSKEGHYFSDLELGTDEGKTRLQGLQVEPLGENQRLILCEGIIFVVPELRVKNFMLQNLLDDLSLTMDITQKWSDAKTRPLIASVGSRNVLPDKGVVQVYLLEEEGRKNTLAYFDQNEYLYEAALQGRLVKKIGEELYLVPVGNNEERFKNALDVTDLYNPDGSCREPSKETVEHWLPLQKHIKAHKKTVLTVIPLLGAAALIKQTYAAFLKTIPAGSKKLGFKTFVKKYAAFIWNEIKTNKRCGAVAFATSMAQLYCLYVARD